MIRWFAFLVLVFAAGVPGSGRAEGIFGGGNKLDPSFCKAHNIRQTVVYVDDTVLVVGNTAWALTIYNKLQATLVPGEQTTLVELSPLTGQSKQVWTGCWPAYSAEQAAKLATQSHIFSTSPLAGLKDQQSFFARDFGIAAEKIEQKGARPASTVTVNPDSAPQKSIIRALASDGARYAHSDNTIRAILYSDLAENSDLGSIFKAQPEEPVGYGEKLGTFLRRSVFYVFGAGVDIKGDGHIQDGLRTFWDNALRSMAANIGGIGTDLDVPNVLPVSARAYTILLRDGDKTLVGRLSLLADNDGTLVDSWIGITRLRNASINGTFHCSGSLDTPSCSLTATTVGGVVTLSPSETIMLNSQSNSSFTGTIGVEGSNVNLPLAAAPAD